MIIHHNSYYDMPHPNREPMPLMVSPYLYMVTCQICINHLHREYTRESVETISDYERSVLEQANL